MKIPKRLTGVAISLLAGLQMSFLMSFVVTLKNLGFVSGFFSHWLWAWLIAYIIGQPLLFVVLPFSRWVAGKITR